MSCAGLSWAGAGMHPCRRGARARPRPASAGEAGHEGCFDHSSVPRIPYWVKRGVLGCQTVDPLPSQREECMVSSTALRCCRPIELSPDFETSAVVWRASAVWQARACMCCSRRRRARAWWCTWQCRTSGVPRLLTSKPACATASLQAVREGVHSTDRHEHNDDATGRLFRFRRRRSDCRQLESGAAHKIVAVHLTVLEHAAPHVMHEHARLYTRWQQNKSGLISPTSLGPPNIRAVRMGTQTAQSPGVRSTRT